MASTIAAGTTAGTALAMAGDTSGALQLQTNGTTTAVTLDTSQNATFAGKVTSAGALTLASNGTTTAVTIDTSQNVGIGTSSPSAKLDVTATSAPNIVVSSVSATGEGSFGFKANGVQNGLVYYNHQYNLMTFSTNATEQMRIDSAGLLKFNSGYGSVATAYGCRAWVNFNGTGTVAIRASGNVSSITDNGAGNYTVNFTTAMPDANYSATVSSLILADINGGLTTTAINNLRTYNDAGTLQDPATVCAAVFR